MPRPPLSLEYRDKRHADHKAQVGGYVEIQEKAELLYILKEQGRTTTEFLQASIQRERRNWLASGKKLPEKEIRAIMDTLAPRWGVRGSKYTPVPLKKLEPWKVFPLHASGQLSTAQAAKLLGVTVKRFKEEAVEWAEKRKEA